MGLKHSKTKPKRLGVYLGTVNYSGTNWRIYNKNGKAIYVAKSGNFWITTDTHSGGGYMLRQLGIEVSASGNIFRHYTLPQNAFRGKNRRGIIKLQRSV